MRPGIIIIVSLLALVGAAFGVRQYAPQILPDQFTTDAVLADRLRAQLAEDENGAAFFEAFERLFPADHQVLLQEYVDLYRRGGTQEQAMALSEGYMSRFIADNTRYASGADAETLVMLGGKIGEGISALRRENPVLCAQYMRQGAAPVLRPNMVSPEARGVFTRIGTAMLESIANGKTTAMTHAEPTEAQWLAWVARFEALGGQPDVLRAMGDPVQAGSLAPAEICEAADIMWVAVLQAEDDFASRFVSYSLRQQ